MPKFFNLKGILSSFAVFSAFFSAEMPAFANPNIHFFTPTGLANTQWPLPRLSPRPPENNRAQRHHFLSLQETMTVFIPAHGNAYNIIRQFFARVDNILQEAGVIQARSRTLFIDIASIPTTSLFENILSALRSEQNCHHAFSFPNIKLRVSQNIFEEAKREFNEFMENHYFSIESFGFVFTLESF